MGRSSASISYRSITIRGNNSLKVALLLPGVSRATASVTLPRSTSRPAPMRAPRQQPTPGTGCPCVRTHVPYSCRIAAGVTGGTRCYGAGYLPVSRPGRPSHSRASHVSRASRSVTRIDRTRVDTQPARRDRAKLRLRGPCPAVRRGARKLGGTFSLSSDCPAIGGTRSLPRSSTPPGVDGVLNSALRPAFRAYSV